MTDEIKKELKVKINEKRKQIVADLLKITREEFKIMYNDVFPQQIDSYDVTDIYKATLQEMLSRKETSEG